MKVLALLLVCVALASAEDVFDQLYRVCAEELDLPIDFIHKAEKGEITVDEKCFSKCFFDKAGFIDEKGEANIEKIKKEVPEVEPEPLRETSMKAIEKCVNAKGKDKCDQFFQMHMCYFKNLPHSH